MFESRLAAILVSESFCNDLTIFIPWNGFSIPENHTIDTNTMKISWLIRVIAISISALRMAVIMEIC